MASELESYYVNGREYKRYVPTNRSGIVCVGLHGTDGTAEGFFGSAQLREIADSTGWTIVLPFDPSGKWSKSDLPYIHEAAQQEANGQIVVCGHSAGSGMAVRLAYDYNGYYCAICCVHSGLPTGLVNRFDPDQYEHPINMLKICSVHDKLDNHDDGLHFARLVAWANGHDPKLPRRSGHASPKVEEFNWFNGVPGGVNEVGFVSLHWQRDGGVHTWPLKSKGSGYDITREMIDFFLRHLSGSVAPDEPTFTIRADDRFGPAIVREYADRVERFYPGAKQTIADAREQANKMTLWQEKHETE